MTNQIVLQLAKDLKKASTTIGALVLSTNLVSCLANYGYSFA